MKTYELLIAERQPTCGGKSPVRSTIRTVSTEDPVAYVRALEPDGELQVTTAEDGALIVETERNGFWVRYEFTED